LPGNLIDYNCGIRLSFSKVRRGDLSEDGTLPWLFQQRL